MNFNFFLKLAIIFILIPSISFATIAKPSQLKKFPSLTLDGDLGGRVDGTSWNSSEIKGKVYTVMYVDPDEKDLNAHVEMALKSEKFPRDKYGSIAIINMDATWKPNFAIESVLKKKQREFKDTIYVKDMKKELVKKWNLKDNSYNVLLFDKEGNLVFNKGGELTIHETNDLVKKIKSLL